MRAIPANRRRRPRVVFLCTWGECSSSTASTPAPDGPSTRQGISSTIAHIACPRRRHSLKSIWSLKATRRVLAASPLPHPRRMGCAAGDGLVQIYVSVPDLDVESTVGIAADPCLVVDGGTLASKIGQGEQVPGLATFAVWPAIVRQLLLLSCQRPKIPSLTRRPKYITHSAALTRPAKCFSRLSSHSSPERYVG